MEAGIERMIMVMVMMKWEWCENEWNREEERGD
jgi:hypothetical protein